MLRSIRLPVALLLLAGCSKLNPVAPAEPPTGIHTFVLRSLDDPRLPTPGPAEVGDLTTGVDPATRGKRPEHDPDPASFWNQTTAELAVAAALPPPRFARAYALTHVAIHDALAASADGRRG